MKIYTKIDYPTENTPWGSLTWYASKALGNTDGITVGKCVIKPGCSNPVHIHPNCEEVLHVLHGDIIHSLGAESAAMKEGDTIAIPAGVPHNAVNTGASDAVLGIAYSTGERKTLYE